MRKKFAAAVILVFAMMCALLGACGSAAVADVPVKDIADKVSTELGSTESMTAVDAGYIKGYMKLDASELADYIVEINAYGTNIDEFGIFKAESSEQAKQLKTAVEAYLQLRIDSWMDEYMPEEKPKITSSEIQTKGNYIMYCILGESEKDTAFSIFDESLKG